MSKRFDDQLSLDASYAMAKGKVTYPLVLVVSEPTDVLPLVLQSVESGTLPITFYYNNKLVEIKRARKSPIELEKLLRFFNLQVFLDANTKVNIETVQDLFDMEGFDWTDS